MARMHSPSRLRAALQALLVTAQLVSGTVAAPAAASGLPRSSQPARFSDLVELTPANVQGLLPLVSRSAAATSGDQGALLPQRSIARGLRMDSRLATAEPARLPPLAARPSSAISYEIGATAADAETAMGAPGERELRAWDPVERRVVWSVTEALPISARSLITAGGLVFYGTTDGWLKALDARTGKTLWKHRAEGRKLDDPFSYRGTDGHQYIAVHSLPRGGAGGRETLLIFALAH